MNETIKPILERGTDEPLVEDSDILGRMVESHVSDCEHGCKYYLDPVTGLMVLGHNSNYGCKKTKGRINA